MAEQPIDPDRVTSWCELCKKEIIGYSNWIKRLDSIEHKIKDKKNPSNSHGIRMV